MGIDELTQNVVSAAFVTVGLMETLKKFMRTEKAWIYTLIMIPVSVGCFFSVVYLPPWVIGGMLTVAASQIGYQTIVKTFGAVVRMFGEKTVNNAGCPADNKEIKQ